MIDLRSDTLSMPTEDMISSIKVNDLGDSARLNKDGRGEDSLVNEIEDYSSQLLGKERALLFSSGTIANTAAILTHCKPKDKVLVDKIQHIYKSEKVAFDERFGQLEPVFYELDSDGTPSLNDLELKLKSNDIKLLIVENTHNFSGGACIGVEKLKSIKALAEKYNVKVHMDGARLFNAAIALNVEAKEIVKHVDSVMFCLSKGLGAPIGSLLLGDKEFIKEAIETRKMLGGNMRQAGVIAAPGLYALKHNIERLKEDNDNAKCVYEMLKSLKLAKVQERVESNILMIDVEKTGMTTEEYCNMAKEKGLFIRPVLPNKVRLVFYKDVNREDSIKAGEILLEMDKELVKLRGE